MNRILGIALISTSLATSAAPTDWKSYLCRYGKDAASEQVQLVKVNEKDGRVTMNDRDRAPKFSPTHITFDGPPEVFWQISRDGGRLLVMGRWGPMNGTCRIVDD